MEQQSTSKSTFNGGGYRARINKSNKKFYSVYLHIQLENILLSGHSIMLVEDVSDIKGQMYLPNAAIRVMQAVPVREKYPDFSPNKQVYKDLCADGKAMLKRLDDLSKLVNPNVHPEQE